MVDQLEFEILMKRNKTNYGEVAEKLGVTLSTLTNKIKRGADISLDETVKLSNILNMTKEDYINVFLKKLFETLV